MYKRQLYYCVKNHTMELLRLLGFLPLNSRDEFNVLRHFLEKKEFDLVFLSQELDLARHNLPDPEFEEIRSLMLEQASIGDIQKAAAFYKLIRYSYGSGCTSFGCQPFDVRKTFHLIWIPILFAVRFSPVRNGYGPHRSCAPFKNRGGQIKESVGFQAAGFLH